ncbi:FAD-binding oxidoreductase [Enterovirga rhinocerotis]|uniref:FAD/FMN-containing dehydrogenase n=1 Tax=Enterovirga rhinocerotis TaxID=1339210 RepID=A0A4R7CD64_9HYPH|nr:FAD-binding oxidoreductase [Enterovirga rhinocerotis]TDR94767.1 FAD/FMN-containing dehydrogenase [Enterovirga rhinocerotis]
MTEPSDFAEAAAALIGPKYVRTDPAETEPFRKDWRGRYAGEALAVVFPGTPDEVAAMLRLCAERGLPVVPQGGNTGLVGGAIPSKDGRAVLINVSRMDRIRETDIANNSVTVEAGCILANLREHADRHDRLFPMLLGSVGSCEVGGLVSTNAGGTGVLRYGNMRDLVLGLEVVLPDGRIWNGLRGLRKDNSGYDLKQLFIGAEGTLGIVTAAVLKLFPKPLVSATAMVSLGSVEKAVSLLELMQNRIGNRIEAFELVSKSQLEIVERHMPALRSPMPLAEPFYALVEIADNAADWNPEEAFAAALEAALEQELIGDAVVATDIAKAERIWALRHNISESNKQEGFTISNDTSVPISQLPAYVERVTEALKREVRDATICHAGHMGDGNLHVIAILSRATYRTPEECEAGAAIVNAIVHEEAVKLNGSISAEHGIGLMHVGRLKKYKPPLDIELMQRLRAAFDPTGMMNPGKIV